jgi:hypothetical protein
MVRISVKTRLFHFKINIPMFLTAFDIFFVPRPGLNALATNTNDPLHTSIRAEAPARIHIRLV